MESYKELIINHETKTITADGVEIPYTSEDGRGPHIAGIQSVEGYITVNVPVLARSVSVVAKKATPRWDEFDFARLITAQVAKNSGAANE